MTEPAVTYTSESAAFTDAVSAQHLAADPAHSAWVEANAGSGKTKVLIDRVARLLLQRPDGRPGAEPDSILCITYTKAAASEMLSRLFERLGRWSTQTDEELRATLSDLVKQQADSFDQAALSRARSLFARALETPGGLRIETIHAFCARVLRRFPLEAGISPGFSELDEDAADELWRECLRSELEPVALRHPDAFRIVSDAAGGRGVDYVLEQLRDNRVAMQRFQRRLLLTKETADSAIRTALEIGEKTPETVLKDALVVNLPRAEIKAAIDEIWASVNTAPDKDKTNKRFAATLTDILDSADLQQAFDAYLRCLAGSKRDWSLKTNPYSGKLLANGAVADLFRRKIDPGQSEGSEIARLRNAHATYQTANIAQQTGALAAIGLPVVEAYQAAKQSRAGLDFDDLIETTRRLFVEKSAADWVLYKLDGGLSHILLDEAQDTSPDQWQLINAIASEFDAGHGADEDNELRTKFVVGDPKQSIYSFQGADQDAFSRERERFAGTSSDSGEAAQFPEMTMSFRSTPEVLAFVDAVRSGAPLESAELNASASEVGQIKPHLAKRFEQSGRVEVWPLEMPEPDAEDRVWDAPVDHVSSEDPPRRLANRIATEISAMLNRGDPVWQENPDRIWYQRPVSPGDILILVRRRSTLFKTLIAALEGQRLPVAGADRLWLNDNLAVQDCLNLMRFSLQPGDDLNLAEILRGPFCNLVDDDRHLFPLSHARARGESLWSRLRNSQSAAHRAAQALCERLARLSDASPFEFLTQILDQRLTEHFTGWECLIKRFGEPARSPIEELVSRALQFDQSEAPSLQLFLSRFDGDPIELKRELGEAGDTIRVMTVHGAKGLQAPIVILPDTTGRTRKTQSSLLFTRDGVPLFSPSARSDSPATAALRDAKNAAQEKESRRLLYVALTRAQDRLIVCGAGTKRPEAGFESSSWYRWCLRGIGISMTGQPFDEAQSEVLTIGASLQPLGSARTEPVSVSLAPTWLDRPPTSIAAGGERVAASRLSTSKPVFDSQLSMERVQAMQRGTLIHSLLHRLMGQPEAGWATAAQEMLSRAGNLSEADKREIGNITLATLRNPELKRYFDSSGRSEVAIVGSLPTGETLTGRVDRLCFLDNEILVIDFKTDRPAPKMASDIDSSYVLQMSAYTHVLEQMYPKKKVSAALLFTDGPKLIRLTEHDLSESLNRYANEV